MFQIVSILKKEPKRKTLKIGLCRLQAPGLSSHHGSHKDIASGKRANWFGVWPGVRGNDWCGQYKFNGREFEGFATNGPLRKSR